MAYQNTFNTIRNVCEFIPLETDIQEIIRAVYKDAEVESNIVCPFCGEDNHDKEGLKYHLQNYCKAYEETK